MEINQNRIQSLSNEKLLLLAKKLQKKKEKIISSSNNITAQNRSQNEWPLSYNQERLWFFDKMLPENPLYNIAGAIQVHGTFKFSVLSKAINSVIDRHEVLRTVFNSGTGKPVQIIKSNLKPGLKYYDIRNYKGEKKQYANRIMKKEAIKTMDLEKGPLVNFTFIKVTELESYLFGVVHHIICDGWSMEILNKDILDAYYELNNNKQSTKQPLSFQHIDYIIHFQKSFTDKRRQQLLRYWKERLNGEIAILELPLDKPRKPKKDFSGDALERMLQPEVLDKLKARSKEASVSLYTLLLGAFKILLYKYSGQSDIIVGSSFANRKYYELKDQIGFYANAIPIRSNIQRHITMREFLKELNLSVIGANEHQEMPFNILVDELGINRDAAISPIFQVQFELQEEISEYEKDQFSSIYIPVHTGTAKFDITLEATPGKAGLYLFLEYSTELFHKKTMEKFFEHYLIILEHILEGIDQQINKIQILTKDQKHQLLYARKNMTNTISRDCTFIDLFDDVAERCKHLVAAYDTFEKVSYLDLKKRSETIAQKILSLSLTRESMIPVFTSRSVKLLSAILGILKSGAAYVPISPKLPEKRVSQILNACKSKVILTTKKHYLELQNIVEKSDDADKIEIISIDKKNGVEDSFSYPATSNRDICYVIFTSGSTGVPKGVMIEQKGMINHLYAKIDDLGINDNDIIAQTASQSFDISIWQFLAVLLKGGTVSIIDTEVVINPTRLIEKVKKERISIVELVPSILDTLIEDMTLMKEIPCLPDLRYLMVTGETVLPETCNNWLKIYPHIPIVNAYGPTECSDDITHYFMAKCNAETVRVPIGTPVANTMIYILDKEMNLVPEGIVGEIYSSGEGVGRGYVGNPEKTSEVFIPDPFSQSPGARMYKTGDLGRWLPDGNIEYFNRIDSQVKVRGFRIELEEIEAMLRMHPHVAQAVVLAKRMKNKNTFLVAYFVPKMKRKIEDYELEQYLGSYLPAYMVPTIYIELDQMPLNQNGKIDRNTLSQISHFKKKKYHAPTSEAEKALSKIWSELLDLKMVSVQDSFFELGGDSLQVIQMVSRARSENMEISPQLVFQNQNIAKLALSAKPIESDAQNMNIGGLFKIPKKQIDKWNKNNSSREASIFYGLTALQAGLLFNQAMTKEAGININQHIISISGKIDIKALQKSWQKLFENHEILKTSFYFEEEVPFQVVHNGVTPVIEKIDLSGKPEKEIAHQLEVLIDEDRARGFNVMHPPLMRMIVVKTGENHTKLLWTLHQIIADGWSIANLGKELFRYYFEGGEHESSLDITRSQYRHYISWLSHQDPFLSKSFWQKHLNNLPETTLLPVSGDHTIVEAKAYKSLKLSVSEKTVNKIKAIAKTHRLTMNVLIQAAWSILYSHYTTSSDFVYGVNVSGRPGKLKDVENIVGLFINTLPLRVKLKWDHSFLELGHQIQKILFEMKKFEYTAIWDISNWVRKTRYTKEEQLYEAIVGFDNYPFDESVSRGKGEIKVEDYYVVERTGYPFVLDIFPGKEFDFKVTFDQRKYDLVFIQRMLFNLRTLIERIADNPLRKISDYSILAQSEIDFLIAHGSNDDLSIIPNQVFQDLYRRQVKKTPDHIAVCYEDKILSYNELDCKVNRLASVLRHRYHINIESKVVLLAERSSNFMATILAVWKAGGVYIPLDPEHPTAHYAKIIKICRPSLVIAERRLLKKIKDAAEVHGLQNTLQIIDFKKFLNENDSKSVKTAYCSLNAAYIIFTSGSTGVPKGVCVEHKGMINHIHSKINILKLTKDDVTAQLASQCFDISVWQFFAPLLTGGRVIILDNTYSLDPFLLLDTVEKNKITVLEMVPSLMRVILDSIDVEGIKKLNSLRWVIATGEALPIDVAQKWNSLFPTVQLLNAYGPTECSDDVTHYIYSGSAKEHLKRVPIGTAIENCRTYVLDKHLAYVPVGVTGELYIGGNGVGRGYVDDPVTTALSFIPDPFSSVPGSRMYKTGDRVMVMENGNLDFISRSDFQVKIRGFRIELGDIETAILSHPEVKNAAVDCFRNSKNNDILIAYVETKINIDQLNLSTWLKSTLPEYMIPSLFIPIDKMPLTSTGKLNRKALPMPKSAQATEGRVYKKPESETEIHLAEKWQEILNLNIVSVNDNFFEVGGHSLDAVKIIFWIKKMYQVELSMVQFFEKPVLGVIAKKIEKQKNSALSLNDFAISKIKPICRDGNFPMSSSQQRLWILESISPGSHVNNLADSIRLRGKLDVSLLEKVYHEIVRKHAVFRTSFRNKDGQPIQVISSKTQFRVNHIYLEAVEDDKLEDEAERIAVLQARKPFDLSQAPLIRIDLIHIRPHDFLMVQTIHHIISDGWSMGILVQEVGKIYSNLTNGKDISNSDSILQYVDYANWNNKFIQSDNITRQLRYWKQKLANDLTEIRLPYDFPVAKEHNYEGDEIRFELPTSLQERMEMVLRKINCTPYMFLLTVFKILLHKYSGETDIIVGTPIANRRTPEVEAMIGFFVNTLVLRTDLSGDPTFDLLLTKVKKVVIDGLQHQDAPFEKVIEIVNPDRNVHRSAMFEIMFNFLVAPELAIDLPNLNMRSKELNKGTARFHLTLTFIEKDKRFTGILNYRVDLFRKETIGRMVLHFLNLMKNILDSSTETPLSKLNLLSSDDYHQVTHTFSHGPSEKRDVICLHHWFERQVAICPDATAVVCDDGELSYSCLDKKANQLARRLTGYGVEPETFIGLCCDRSIYYLVGMLAILKAGGAYIPLDPAIPNKRNRYIIKNANAKVLLIQEKYRTDFIGIDIPVLDVNGDYFNESEAKLDIPVQPNHPVYAIYTSGTTGNPQGVVVEHKQLFNLLKSSIDTFELEPGFSYAMVSTFAADLQFTVLLPALCTGGCLHIINSDLALEPNGLAMYFYKQKIDCLKITPNHMNALLNGMKPEKMIHIKRLIFGGERLTLNLVRRIKRLSQCKIYNEYGPTETTVAVCSRLIDVNAEKTSSGTIDIGRPFPGNQLYVLDNNMNPLPVGIAGELHIGGVQVSRGYLNNPEKTALSFVPNPFSGNKDRIYKTGDLVKWLPSGHLKFIKRLDDQVKIRGYRVELSEIENVLNSLEQVKESVVVTRLDQYGNTNIVAYVIAAVKRLDTNNIIAKIKRLLPVYMMPHEYVKIDKIPLNANGKVNKKELPQHDYGMIKKKSCRPMKNLEKIFVEIWSQVLGTEKIDIDDNFFTIGGDSMMIILIVSQAAKKGITIRSRQIFEHQTIRELAKEVKQDQSEKSMAKAFTGDVPLTPVQRRFFSLNMENRNHAHLCFLLDLLQPLHVMTLSNSLSVTLEHHDLLRARYKKDKKRGWIQKILAEKEKAIIECQSYADIAEVEQHIEQAVRTIDLLRGPIIRLIYYQGGEDKKDLLFFCIHHLVFDVYSIHIFMDDLFNTYRRLSDHKESALPTKTTTYQQWASHLYEYSKGTQISKEKDYWLSLSKANIPKIPVDFPDGKNVWSSWSRLNSSLDRSTTNRLLREVPGKLGIQIHEALISAVSTAISEMTQNCMVLLELEGHGREDLSQIQDDIDVSRTIGWFTAHYPVLIEVINDEKEEKKAMNIAQQLKSVPKNGIGFGILQYLSDNQNLKKSLRKISFPEVTVNYQGQFDQLMAKSSIVKMNSEIDVVKYAWNSEFKRPRKIQIIGFVMNHRLNISIEYSKNQYLEETIKLIMQKITSFLKRFAD